MQVGDKAMRQYLKEANKTLKIVNLNDQIIGEGGICLPEDFDHNLSLFGTGGWNATELAKGELIDMSKLRGPTNIEKWFKPFTGRRFEVYKLVKYLDEYNIVSLIGPHGIGKTHMAHEVSYYLNSRYFFHQGNYYFDCKHVKTAEHCKSMLKEASCDYMMEDTLLILDDIDALWKKYKSQFRWWIMDVASRFKAKILLTSTFSIEQDLQNEFVTVKELELGPLNEYESADLLLATTKRNITLNELCLPEGAIKLHSALQMDEKLKHCMGIPQYICILSGLLEYNEWDNIDIKKEIPSYLRAENKRRMRAMTQVQHDKLELREGPTLRERKPKQLADKGKSHSFSQKNSSFRRPGKKENPKTKKKREHKEKKVKERLESPYFMSKNERKKLRPIKEEDHEHLHNSSSKQENYFDNDVDMSKKESEDMTIEDNDHHMHEIDFKPILKKKMTPAERENSDLSLSQKSQSFVVKDDNDVANIVKKHLSFNLDKHETEKQPPLNRKKSSNKSKNREKEYQDKLRKRRKENFIPIRESQIDDILWIASQPLVKNKDDFDVKVPKYHRIEISEPKMKRKGVSYMVPNAFDDEPLDFDSEDFMKSSELSVKNKKLNKFQSSKENIIYEHTSEDAQSSKNDSLMNQKQTQEIDDFLMPNIAEAQRKRVNSIKKISSNKFEESKEDHQYFKTKDNSNTNKNTKNDDKDPYLEVDDDDEFMFDDSNMIQSSKSKVQTYKEPSLNDFFKSSGPIGETYLEARHIMSKDSKKSNTFKMEKEIEVSVFDDNKKKIADNTSHFKRTSFEVDRGSQDDLLDTALERAHNESYNKFHHKNSQVPFSWSEDVIEDLHDEYMEGMSIFENEANIDNSLKYKKGPQSFRKGDSGKHTSKKKGGKTGKKAKQYMKNTKKKYNPHGTKDQGKRSKSKNDR